MLLGGCGLNRLRTDISARPASTGGEEGALLQNLRIAYVSASGCGGENKSNCRKFSTDLDPTQVVHFMNAGMTLSDYYCDLFFRQANASARQRRFGRNVSNDVGGAIATALGLAGAASGVVGGVAAGFSFADSSFRNYDESFMVDADLSKMRRLVLSAQDNMKLGINANPPRTVFAAESKIIRYAGLCSFLGMQDLLNESVGEKTRKIDEDNKAKTDTVNGTVVDSEAEALPEAEPAPAFTVAPPPSPG
jgi:hypothetical protein